MKKTFFYLFFLLVFPMHGFAYDMHCVFENEPNEPEAFLISIEGNILSIEDGILMVSHFVRTGSDGVSTSGIRVIKRPYNTPNTNSYKISEKVGAELCYEPNNSYPDNWWDYGKLCLDNNSISVTSGGYTISGTCSARK